MIKFIEMISCKFSDKIITVTEGCKQLLIKRNVPAEKISLILNAPDQKIFKFDSTRGFQVITKNAVLLYHGTVAERFGLHDAIDAMVFINKAIPGSIFRIFGKYDEKYRKILEKKIVTLELTGIVILDEERTLEEISEFIRESDIGIVPYINNTYMNLALSTKTFEYAASGLPIVATKLRTLSTIFDNNSISYTSSGNPEDLAEKVINLCMGPELRRKQAVNANNSMNEISDNIMAARYMNLVNTVISRNKLIISEQLAKRRMKYYKKVL